MEEPSFMPVASKHVPRNVTYYFSKSFPYGTQEKACQSSKYGSNILHFVFGEHLFSRFWEIPTFYKHFPELFCLIFLNINLCTLKQRSPCTSCANIHVWCCSFLAFFPALATWLVWCRNQVPSFSAYLVGFWLWSCDDCECSLGICIQWDTHGIDCHPKG